MDLKDDILQIIKRGVRHPCSDAEFNLLALALFEHQHHRNVAARQFWNKNGVSPKLVSHWSEIPPIPQAAFKSLTLTTFDPKDAICVFRTSGTSEDIRGEHYLQTIELYEAAALASFEAHVLPDNVRIPMLALLPSPPSAPDSSLSRMAGFVERFFCRDLGASYWMTGSELNYRQLLHCIEEHVQAENPVLLFGTTFALVHLLDHMATDGLRLKLPAGSRAMETGGLKGKSREIRRSELLILLQRHLGLDPRYVVNEYGMTELSSQMYLDSMSNPDSRQPLWVAPPWLRVRVLDPTTLRDVPTGTVGLLALYDLANVGSVLAILTSDFGRLESDGRVGVLGRAPAVDRRGCSWAADVALTTPLEHIRRPKNAFSTSRAAEEEQNLVLGQIASLRGAQVALSTHSPLQVAHVLGKLSENWLKPSYQFRVQAITKLERTTGLHRSVLALGMDRSFSQWTVGALSRLAADRPVSSSFAKCVYPKLTLVVAASNVPTPVVFDIFSGLLLQSAVLIKSPTLDNGFAQIFIDSLRDLDPTLGANVALASWVGGNAEVERVVCSQVDAIIANGTDQAVSDLRSRAPLSTPFLARGSRSSVVVLDCDGLHRADLAAWAEAVAVDVVLWDQQGCLSPSVVYVKPNDALSIWEVGFALNDALSKWDDRAPCGRQTLAAAAYSRAAWDSASMAELAGQSVRVLSHVVVDERDKTPERLAGRRLWVVPLVDKAGSLRSLTSGSERISTIVLTAPAGLRESIVALGVDAGASRICEPGAAQSPPSWWHHDGVDVQHGLVRWVDIELVKRG